MPAARYLSLGINRESAMRISPAYQLRIALEERIGRNARAQALYRWYMSLPEWERNAIETAWFILDLAPLFLITICEWLGGKLPGGKKEDTSFAIFLAILGLLVYLHPLGWIVICMAIQFYGLLWFGIVMQDYAYRSDPAERETD